MAVKIPTHDQLDYPFLIFKQIDRCEEALSGNRQYVFVNGIIGLEILVSHLVIEDKEYKKIREINKKNFNKGIYELQGRRETQEIRDKAEQLQFQAAINIFRALIALLDRHNMFPRESKSMEDED